MKRSFRSRRGRAAAAVFLAFALLDCGATEQQPLGAPVPEPPPITSPVAASEVEAAFRARTEGRWVEGAGRVARLLADDRDGSPHQRFVVRLSSGHTVLIVHNLDLAARAPVRIDDPVRFRGKYEWNERGGLVHWTHDEPSGGGPGGWVEHQGRRYE